MAKTYDYSNEKPKKSFFKIFFNKNAETKKILKFIDEKNIKNLLFYTNVSNLLLILENGIQLLKNKKLKKEEEYEVWTYLENNNSIGFEMDNSSRANFWKWSTDLDVNINDIAVIGINPNKLADLTKNDWAFDDITKITYVYEDVSINAIEWVMVKKRNEIERLENYIKVNNLDIEVFFGEKGNIEKIDKKNKK